MNIKCTKLKRRYELIKWSLRKRMDEFSSRKIFHCKIKNNRCSPRYRRCSHRSGLSQSRSYGSRSESKKNSMHYNYNNTLYKSPKWQGCATSLICVLLHSWNGYIRRCPDQVCWTVHRCYDEGNRNLRLIWERYLIRNCARYFFAYPYNTPVKACCVVFIK